MDNEGDYTSNERLYLDKDGNVVGEDDPSRLTLLVAKGGRLSMDKARKYGLTNRASTEDGGDKVESINVEAKAVVAAPENKALSPAENKTASKKAAKKARK